MARTLRSSENVVPEALREFDIWAVWSPEFGKQILAPWATGHCYRAKWGADETNRPETDYDSAKMIADLPPREVHESYPFPPADDGPGHHIPDQLMPTIMLPHDPPEPPIMLVDFDDVRDPETGEVSPEVAAIVDALDAYTEISQSGEGLHIYVRAALPGGLGKFIEPLEMEGDIEMYDHGRVVGATWDHVDGTPMDVPERQDVVDELVDTYESESTQQKREHPPAAHADGGSSSSIHAAIRDRGDGPKRSPYFDIDITSIADTGDFSRYRSETPDHDWQGPHPAHGPMHSSLDECTNFGVDTGSNTWYCFAHGAGGRAIELAAVLSPNVDVSCADLPDNAAQYGWLAERPLTLLKTCLWLRDEGGVPDDARPPHAALLAVSGLFDIHIRDADRGILGDKNAELCRHVYSDLTVDDVDDLAE